MAASSSVSTFLDVTQAARRGEATPAGVDPELPTRASVLRSVRDGARLAKEVSERTGLETTETLATLVWLSRNRLVELSEVDGEITVQLTDWARKGLESDPPD
jgi:hypothetical protein